MLLTIATTAAVDPTLTKIKYAWPLLPALLLARYSKWMLRIALVMLLIFALYSPIATIYGRPTLAMLASALETTPNESGEFLSNIRWVSYLIGIGFIILSILYYRTATLFKARKIAYVLIIPTFLYTLMSSWPGTLIRDTIRHSIRYTENHQQLVASLAKQDSWQISTNADHNRYQNYVLIIGESARKDYFSLYGYPHKTTPWLDQSNGIFIDGMLASGANTIAALSHTLQQLDEHGNAIPENNIITLANKAGYQTYWLSNQGRLGKYDTSTSFVAMRTKKATFLNNGTWADTNYDDNLLLDKLASTLDQPEPNNTPRLIVMHTLGSHPIACERLHGFPNHFDLNHGQDLNCYLASIEKTDDFIHQTADILAQHGSYSLIYFSDHGLSITPQAITQSDDIINSYEVPLILIDSDAQAHRVVQKALSGAHFIDIFASWLGIDIKGYTEEYDLRQPDKLPEDKNIQIYQRDHLTDPATLPREPLMQ
ncbi:phosphoethanolamine transferase [Cardiobacteriaceae bacterium TAE3-ERU3]|nr:phosphoethanolamine transferase [Cardiobacteriaceae bacterium TAE3-ERU3]